MTTKVSFRMMCLAAGCVLVMGSCKKSNSLAAGPEGMPVLNIQEQALLGKWVLKSSETYEISGVDSAGNLILNPIGTCTYSAGCRIEFKSDAFDSGNQYHRAAGSFAGCDSAAAFPWKIKQFFKLDMLTGPLYDITQLCRDSVTFSAVYVKDILKLKSVYHYRRN